MGVCCSWREERDFPEGSSALQCIAFRLISARVGALVIREELEREGFAGVMFEGYLRHFRDCMWECIYTIHIKYL
jgi:hypothetical protein